MPIFDAQGKVSGIVNSVVDITQRLQVEDQVQHQLMKLTENQIKMELPLIIRPWLRELDFRSSRKNGHKGLLPLVWGWP
jgi:hypothetical protein